MDWQISEDTVPSAFVSPERLRESLGRPPATGAWREGDPVAARRFVDVGDLPLEAGGTLPHVRIAYETFGRLAPARDNVVVVLHALTGDAHLAGPAEPGQLTSGWWGGVVGRGLPIDTDRWFVVAPNILGGCQGTTGPASLAPDGVEWASRFPFLTIRDQVTAHIALLEALGIGRVESVIGGSMGGMHTLEWAIREPDRMRTIAVLAAPPLSTADQIALNSVQTDAVRADPAFRGGEYYDADAGEGPHRGLALARRMALLNYRSANELNDRFGRAWQSGITPLGGAGRFAVESYLDFHGNRFVRRFDANSYVRLVEAMSSHDIGRDRGGVEAALGLVRAQALIVGIDSDRLYPIEDQRRIAAALPHSVSGSTPLVFSSPYGHDGFLIETELVGRALGGLLGG